MNAGAEIGCCEEHGGVRRRRDAPSDIMRDDRLVRQLDGIWDGAMAARRPDAMRERSRRPRLCTPAVEKFDRDQ
jgi:hypothetical protein